jgi:hypothetical protein
MVNERFSASEAPLILAQSAVRTVESPSTSSEVEVSIVIPCLNEAETVGICVEKALRWIRDKDIRGEVILADKCLFSTAGGAILCSACWRESG